MSLTLFLARRHIGNPRHSRAITLTALLAMGGIHLGVAVLTIYLSVMNGLERELAGLIQRGEAHIELRPDAAAGVADVDQLSAAVLELPAVVAAAPFVRSEVLFVHRARDGRSHLETATLTGIDPEAEAGVTEVLELCQPPFTGFDTESAPGPRDGLLLGAVLAENLRVIPGDSLQIVVPDASSARSSSLDSLKGRQAWRSVLGIIDSKLYDFNASQAFGAIGPSAEFLRVVGEAQGLSLRCGDPDRADAIALELAAQPALAGYRFETWQDKNRVLFEAMAREKALMYLFLLLTVLIAGLGIIGPLTLMISEKRAEIGILRTLGMRRRAIMGLFVLEGWLVGIIGVLSGLAHGWFWASTLEKHPLRIPWELFVLDTVPILLNPIDFVWVGSITLAVCLLATLYPGWEAARLHPIEAIRGT